MIGGEYAYAVAKALSDSGIGYITVRNSKNKLPKRPVFTLNKSQYKKFITVLVKEIKKIKAARK